MSKTERYVNEDDDDFEEIKLFIKCPFCGAPTSKDIDGLSDAICGCCGADLTGDTWERC